MKIRTPGTFFPLVATMVLMMSSPATHAADSSSPAPVRLDADKMAGLDLTAIPPDAKKTPEKLAEEAWEIITGSNSNDA